MMDEKIIAGGNLSNILCRLYCCIAIFEFVQGEATEIIVDALYGACDLLKCITKDLEEDIERASNYKPVEK